MILLIMDVLKDFSEIPKLKVLTMKYYICFYENTTDH